MSHPEHSKLQKHEKEELAVVYGALLLSDAGIALDAAKLEALGKASGNHINSAYANLFVKALKGKKIESLLSVGGGSGGAGPSDGGAKKDAKEEKKDEKKDAKKETKKEPVKEEPKEEDIDMGGGLGLFDEEF